ncbi:hypothetical protein PYCC9005_004891 [Savitreella phatthalungensis]
MKLAIRVAVILTIALCILGGLFHGAGGDTAALRSTLVNAASRMTGGGGGAASAMTSSDGVVAGKMVNETAKAALGRSSWHLFHTTLARVPDRIEDQEGRKELEMWVRLFGKYYPCGECAAHFLKLLDKYPPQAGGRKAAALWGCRVHNEVNKRLGKGEYDCTTVLEDYDCGCGQTDPPSPGSSPGR